MPHSLDTTGSLDKVKVSPRWQRLLFLMFVAIFLYLLLFKLPAIPFFGDSDQSIFIYEAQRILYGDVMYRDFFEFTLPGTQAVYALLFSLFGVKYWIVGALTIIVGGLTAWLLLKISERLIESPLSYLPSVFYIFFGFRWFGLDGSHRMFSPIFILVAISLLMNGKGTRNLALGGAALGFASFFTQQRGFIVLAAVLVFLLVDKFYNHDRWPVLFKSAFASILAFAVCLAALSAYFIYAAGADNFFYATLEYPFRYYSYGHPNNFGVLYVDLNKAFTITKSSDILELGPVVFYTFILPLGNPLLLLVFAVKRKSVDWRRWRVPVLISLIGLFLSISTTAPNQYRLFQIAGPSLIVFVWLIGQIKFSPTFKRRLIYSICGVLFALGIFQAIRMQTHWEFTYLDAPVGKLAMVVSPQSERYQWLARHTAPGDYFFEVYEPFVYFPLGLKNPTRYGQIWPSDYTRPEQVAEVIGDLDKKRPKYILWDNGYLESDTPRSAGDHTGPLADFVAMHYLPIGDIYEIDGRSIQIWEIKPYSN